VALGVTECEIAVVGAGIAGSTAGLFAARLGRDTVVLGGGLPGGQLLNVGKIEDYPGFPAGVAGYELCPSIQDQALAAGASFELAQATGLEERQGGWAVTTEGGEITARAVIVASGSTQRQLGIPGEEALVGRGISHCATCDGPLYREQVVGVVGGGDSALQEALELTEHVDTVIVVHRGESFSGQSSYRRRIEESPKVEVRLSTVVEEIRGDGRLSAIVARDLRTREAAEVPLGGLFVYVGSAPNADFLPEALSRDHHGRVVTDARMRTALPGLLAAGDIRSESAAQAVAAAGDGATAAVTAHRYLAGESWPR
jgi:thioredoxin reductase (NADPH)